MTKNRALILCCGFLLVGCAGKSVQSAREQDRQPAQYNAKVVVPTEELKPTKGQFTLGGGVDFEYTVEDRGFGYSSGTNVSEAVKVYLMEFTSLRSLSSWTQTIYELGIDSSEKCSELGQIAYEQIPAKMKLGMTSTSTSTSKSEPSESGAFIGTDGQLHAKFKCRTSTEFVPANP